MSQTVPYEQNNYLGEYADTAAAVIQLKADHWDTNNDGTGDPQDGMWYTNTTDNLPLMYLNGSWIPFIMGYFGNDAQDASVEVEQNTTSTIYIQALRLTTTNLPAGNYRVEYCAEMQGVNGVSRFTDIQVEIDDTTLIAEYSDVDSQSWLSVSGFWNGAIAAGVHTIDVDFKRNGTSGTARIRRVRLTLWRTGS